MALTITCVCNKWNQKAPQEKSMYEGNLNPVHLGQTTRGQRSAKHNICAVNLFKWLVYPWT